MLLHAQRQRLDAGENQERVEGRERGTEIAQAQHAAGNREGEIAERLLNLDAVIFGTWLAQHRIFVVLRPVEGAGIDNDAADRVAVAAQEFRQRVHDNVSAVVDRTDQIGCRQRVVDDQWYAGVAGNRRDGLDIGDAAAGVRNRLDEDRLGARRDRALETADIVGVGPCYVPAEALEGVGELVDRATVELTRRDELVAGHQQLLEHNNLRGVS